MISKSSDLNFDLLFKPNDDGAYETVSFDSSISVDELKNCLLAIIKAYDGLKLDSSTENQVIPQPVFNLRGVQTDVLAEGMKVLLNCETIVNASLLLNIYNLVKKYNSFDSEFFNSESNWFIDAEQFLTIKRLTSSECQEFINKLSLWFLSSLYSMHKVEYTMMDIPQNMPLTYHYFILISDFFTISALLAKSKVDLSELKLVNRAYMYIGELSTRTALSFKLMENL